MTVVPFGQLSQFAKDCLRHTALPGESADVIADALITSELRNLQGQGQGVRRVRQYVGYVEKGDVDPTAPFEIVRESPATALVDGHGNSGIVTAVRSMRLAVEKAKINGVGSSWPGTVRISGQRATPRARPCRTVASV